MCAQKRAYSSLGSLKIIVLENKFYDIKPFLHPLDSTFMQPLTKCVISDFAELGS